jgi:hypothetical protein
MHHAYDRCGALLALLLAACGGPSAPDDTTVETPTTGSSSTGDPSPTTAAPPTSGDTGSSGDTGDSTGEPPALDPRVEDCLRVAACEADGGRPIGVQACLAHALDVPWRWATTGPARLGLAAMDCKLAASDCEAVRACTPAVDAFADACADSPGLDMCVGDTWLFCDDVGAPLVAMDCAAAGLACHRDIWAGCGGETCEFGATAATCDGDTLIECDAAGNLVHVDCTTQYNYVIVHGMAGDEVYAIAGETCGYDEMRGAMGCVGTGEACGFFSQTCDGAALETCAGGKLARRDCAALDPAGQACGYVQTGPFAGAAACGYVEPACDLAADETCAGGKLGYCAFDRAAELDCAAHGFSGCAQASVDGRTIAWCAP